MCSFLIDYVRFVPFACKKENVALLCNAERMLDSILARNDRNVVCSPVAHTAYDICNDILGLLISWVIARDNGNVGKARGDITHFKSLAAIAVAAATENAIELAARYFSACLQRFYERVGRVCIVDDYREGERVFRNGLHSSGNAGKARERCGDIFFIDTDKACGNGRLRCVVYIEITCYGKGDRRFFAAVRERIAHAVVRNFNIFYCIFRLFFCGNKVDLTFCAGGNFARLFVIKVDNGVAAEREEGGFYARIFLHCFVVIEVVARDVRENTYLKAERANAALRHSMGGNLHNGIFCTVFERFRKKGRELFGWGSCVGGRVKCAAYVVADGGEHSAFFARIRDYLFYHVRYGRFAVCAGNADYLDFILRIAYGGEAGARESGAHIAHEHGGHGKGEGHFFGNDAGSAFFCRFEGVLCAVVLHARHSEECIACVYHACITANSVYI